MVNQRKIFFYRVALVRGKPIMQSDDPEYHSVFGMREERLMTVLDEYKLNEAFNCIDACYHEATGTSGWANMTGTGQGKPVVTA